MHHLREALNSLPAGKELEQDAIVKYDAPVIASTVKLWLLELDPPLGTWEGWEEIRRLYPQGQWVLLPTLGIDVYLFCISWFKA